MDFEDWRDKQFRKLKKKVENVRKKTITKAIKKFRKEYTKKFYHKNEDLTQRDIDFFGKDAYTLDVLDEICTMDLIGVKEIRVDDLIKLKALENRDWLWDDVDLKTVLAALNQYGFLKYNENIEDPAYSITEKGNFYAMAIIDILSWASDEPMYVIKELE